MSRVLRRLLVALAATLLSAAVLLVPTSATGSSSATASTGVDRGDTIRRYDLTIELDEDGMAHVTLDLDVDFGESPGRGPFLTYVVKQPFDDEQDRVYRIRDVQAETDTASDEVDVEEEGDRLLIRIGEEDREEFTGVHSYRVTYTVEGWINSASYFGPTTGLEEDELNLNVITDWQIPVENVTVRVEAPQEATGSLCFVGAQESQEPCTSAERDADGAVFTQDAVARGQGLTVVAAFDAGTFGGVEPILQDRWALNRAFAVTPTTGGLAALLTVGGIGLAVRRGRRHGRDEQYLGLTPGLAPAAGQESAVGAKRRGPVAVQFTPPEGFHAGQLGTLIDEHADPHDVTATLVDLAVRGYLRIEKVTPEDEDSEDDWRLVRLDNQRDGELLAYERDLLSEVFDARVQVSLSDLRTTFAASMAVVQRGLYQDVTERGWFRGNPASVRSSWRGAGAALLIGGLVLTALLAIRTSWALSGLSLVATGIAVLMLARSAPARTAAGTAVLAQAQGFRQYLATAEANQIRFEEGEDVFSRYLPLAIAFGLTERWAKVFEELAAQGRALPEPTWYMGPGGHAFAWYGAGAFSQELTRFTDITDQAISAPAPSTSGSSGSSGMSGGFSGGGVSGGGGGTW